MSSTTNNSMQTPAGPWLHSRLSTLSTTAPVAVQKTLSGELFKFDFAHTPIQRRVTEQRSQSPAVPDNYKHTPNLLRKRFYPAQWRLAIEQKLAALTSGRGLRLHWIGWDRSLPRLYLPLDALTRVITEAVDAIAAQVVVQPNRSPEDSPPLCFKVSQQSVGTSTCLVLVIEHETWNCNPPSQAALNTTSLLSSCSAQFDRVRRQIMGLGGTTFVRQRLGGGTSLRITLPVDQPMSLVRTWLEQLLDNQPHPSNSSQGLHLYLNIVGRARHETSAQLQAADERLQSLIEPTELIYRTASARWLWLRTDGQLPQFAQTDRWLTAQVAAWRVHPSLAQSNHSQNLFNRLTTEISRTMQRLIGQSIPPLDCIVGGVGMPSSRHRLEKPRPSAPARWRYPI